jgi:hypothetical protein
MKVLEVEDWNQEFLVLERITKINVSEKEACIKAAKYCDFDIIGFKQLGETALCELWVQKGINLTDFWNKSGLI